MTKLSTILLFSVGTLTLSACSILGKSDVEVAPYNVMHTDGQIEIRHYDMLVLVSTQMNGDMDETRAAFNKLFRYISGENAGTAKIEMTAPVFMNPETSKSEEIAMTAPVFMNQDENKKWKMSFVLPSSFDYETAPTPRDPDVTVEKIVDLDVAVIRFSGLLSKDNALKHRSKLESWIEENDYTISGPFKIAGYNPPWTLPNMRRNEVLIPIVKR